MSVIAETILNHDPRRWIRWNKADGSFDRLQCYCGEKFYEDSEAVMFEHIAEAIAREIGHE